MARPAAPLFLALALGGLVVPAMAAGQPAPAATPAPPRIETVDLPGPNGRTYRISIARPDKPAPAAGYPVIYVLDGNAIFATVADSARMQGGRPDWNGFGQALVVGVGLPTEALYDSAQRAFDYTPELPQDAPRPDERAPRGGGADAFLAFIEAQVKPLVQAKMPVDKSSQTLMGYSLSGLFTVHAFLTKPGAFRNYVAISPSLWWADGQLLRDAGRLAASGQRRDARLLMTVGEYEQALSPAGRAAPAAADQAKALARFRMVERSGEMAGILRRVPGLTVRQTVLSGQDHASTPPAAISLGIRFALLPDDQFELPK
jgi:hypothetical protein